MSALQHPVIRALTIVVLLASGLGLMFTVYRIRLEELGQNLESAADKTMALRSLGLIAKYRLIQSRMKSGETIALLRDSYLLRACRSCLCETHNFKGKELTVAHQ